MMTPEDYDTMQRLSEAVDVADKAAAEARSQLFGAVALMESIAPGLREVYEHAGKKLNGILMDPANLLNLVRRTLRRRPTEVVAAPPDAAQREEGSP